MKQALFSHNFSDSHNQNPLQLMNFQHILNICLIYVLTLFNDS